MRQSKYLYKCIQFIKKNTIKYRTFLRSADPAAQHNLNN